MATVNNKRVYTLTESDTKKLHDWLVDIFTYISKQNIIIDEYEKQ